MRKIINELSKYKNFLVVSHANMEGDAIGSSLALAKLLKLMGKHVLVVNEDSVPAQYSFLPQTKSIKRPKSSFKFDAAALVDCSDLTRIGSVKNILPKEKIVVNIDHHAKNDNFARVNWVDSKASSCCEMIYKLFKYKKLPIDKETALLLYTGILTDTGSFKYSNTSSFTHKMASELLSFGFNVYQIYKNIYSNLSIEDSKKVLEILKNIKFDSSKKIVYLEQKKAQLNSNSGYDISEYVLDFARSIDQVEIVIFLKETLEKDKIRINLRSKGRYDVNRLAKIFGGGGHKTASGCNIKGTLNYAKKQVLRAAKQFL